MKKVAIITVVGVALLVLATGAWVADGARAVLGAGRRRRSRHGADYVPEGPERFAVA